MATGITIRVTGVEQAIQALAAKEQYLSGRLKGACKQTLDQGKEHMRQVLSGPSPSRPGEPPGLRTGAYRASWRYLTDPDGHGGKLWTESPYARPLEYGTARMAARPHVGLTVAYMSTAFPRNAKEALKS